MTDYTTLETTAEAGWLTIRLNRPEARNALSAEMVDELLALLGQTAIDPLIRGVTLRGNGGTFCAGGDLKGFKSGLQAQSDLAPIEVASRQAGELFHRINTLPQVVVILVEGAAMAGGLGMVCAADVVAVTKDAKFALTEVTLGIPPAQIAPYVAARLGLAAARRLMLTAARFDGVEAGRIGLADYVVSTPGELDQVEADIRKSVRNCAPFANAVTKDILLATQTLPADQMRNYAAKGFAKCLAGDEGREGIAAFLEKRKPAWAMD